MNFSIILNLKLNERCNEKMDKVKRNRNILNMSDVITILINMKKILC